MGAWGAGAFENDMALDWLAELAESDDDAVLRSALEPAAAAVDTADVDSGDATIALTAAEVVAAAKGQAAEDLPEEVDGWLEDRRSAVGDDLVALATRAVERVAANSELRDLWLEADDAEWAASVADLQARLAAVTG